MEKNVIPTPHITAKKSEIAQVVIMPGDPLRAKFIAENFLQEAKLVNKVRNMLMYTGKYRGVPVTIASSGMGMPSIGIYSYELFKFYDVECIMRVGSAGAYQPDLKVYDIINVEQAYSESTFAQYAANYHESVIKSSPEVFNTINEVAAKTSATTIGGAINLKTGLVHSSDIFYRSPESENNDKMLKACLAVEMESFALFANALYLNKKAGCLLTISDSLVTGESISADLRETSFKKMMVLALESAIALVKKEQK